jgi:hypothetical protein
MAWALCAAWWFHYAEWDAEAFGGIVLRTVVHDRLLVERLAGRRTRNGVDQLRRWYEQFYVDVEDVTPD